MKDFIGRRAYPVSLEDIFYFPAEQAQGIDINGKEAAV